MKQTIKALITSMLAFMLMISVGCKKELTDVPAPPQQALSVAEESGSIELARAAGTFSKAGAFRTAALGTTVPACSVDAFVDALGLRGAKEYSYDSLKTVPQSGYQYIGTVSAACTNGQIIVKDFASLKINPTSWILYKAAGIYWLRVNGGNYILPLYRYNDDPTRVRKQIKLVSYNNGARSFITVYTVLPVDGTYNYRFLDVTALHLFLAPKSNCGDAELDKAATVPQAYIQPLNYLLEQPNTYGWTTFKIWTGYCTAYGPRGGDLPAYTPTGNGLSLFSRKGSENNLRFYYRGNGANYELFLWDTPVQGSKKLIFLFDFSPTAGWFRVNTWVTSSSPAYGLPTEWKDVTYFKGHK